MFTYRHDGSTAGVEPGGNHMEHVDVLIVGAGLSGIGAAYHLKKHCPAKSLRLRRFSKRRIIGASLVDRS